MEALQSRFHRSGFVCCGVHRVRNSTATGANLLVKLENAAMAGVGIDDQLGALDAAVQVLGKIGGHHPVVVAVGDEGRLGDLRQVGGAERPHFLIAFSCVWNAFTLIGASRSTVRSLSRLTNARAAGLPVALRLKNRNSFGSERVSVARSMSK